MEKAMLRSKIILPIALLALAASACGGAQPADAVGAPAPEAAGTDAAGARGGDACASITSPEACVGECEWSPGESKCKDKRGVIVETKDPKDPPPPPPEPPG
jgi:hypothetical protein